MNTTTIRRLRPDRDRQLQHSSCRRRFKAEHILKPGAWETRTLFEVNFKPIGMTADELQAGLVDLVRRIYSKQAITQRCRGFFRGLDRSLRSMLKRYSASPTL